MSENLDVNVPAGLAANVHVVPLGPLESRRIRRRRLEAAAASLASPIASHEAGSSGTLPAQSQVLFFDELAAARYRRLIAADSAEHTPSTDDDLVS